MSSAYPRAQQPFPLSRPMSSSPRLQNRGDRMPPCGEPLATDPFTVSPAAWLWLFLHSVWTQSINRRCLQAHAVCYDVKWGNIERSFNICESCKCNFPAFHCFLYICVWSHDTVRFQWTSLVERQIGTDVGNIAPKSNPWYARSAIFPLFPAWRMTGLSLSIVGLPGFRDVTMSSLQALGMYPLARQGIKIRHR
jgi:hypothetical protein